jgi:hypothetical protein
LYLTEPGHKDHDRLLYIGPLGGFGRSGECWGMYTDAPDSLLIGRVGLHGLRLGDIYILMGDDEEAQRIRTRAQYREAE